MAWHAVIWVVSVSSLNAFSSFSGCLRCRSRPSSPFHSTLVFGAGKGIDATTDGEK